MNNFTGDEANAASKWKMWVDKGLSLEKYCPSHHIGPKAEQLSHFGSKSSEYLNQAYTEHDKFYLHVEET